MSKKKLLYFLKIVWILAVLVGVSYYLANNFNSALNYFKTIGPEKLIASLLLLTAVRIITINLVKNSLTSVNWQPNFLKAFIFVSISQMGKYIPGGIWQIAARLTTYKENGLSNKDTGKAFILENIWMVCGSFLVGIFFIFISQPESLLNRLSIKLSPRSEFGIAILSFIVWVLTLFFSEKYFRRQERKLSYRKFLWNFVSQTVMWVLYGMSLLILFPSQLSVKEALFCIGAAGLSFFAGYVVIIAPGGLGIREAAAGMLFVPMFSSIEIGVYSLAHRLLYTLIEFLLAGVSVILLRRQNNLNHKNIKN